MIHLDPCLDQECPVCGQSLCTLRHSHQNQLVQWTLASMTAIIAMKKETARDVVTNSDHINIDIRYHIL
jgi:hypothetical protein